MSRRLRIVGLLVSVLLSVLASGCDRCGSATEKRTLATLRALVGGGVTRDHAEQLLAWQPAHDGESLTLGDGARTDARSTAELAFITGATLALEPNTVVRLLPDEAGGHETALDVETGEAILRVAGGAMILRTHFGLATIAPESEVRLSRNGDALGFRVALGNLTFRDRQDAPVDLRSGDSVRIGIGMAVLELTRAEQPPPAAPGIALEVLRGTAQVSEADGSLGGTLEQGTHMVTPGTLLRLPQGAEVIVRRGAERVSLRGAGEFVVGVENALAEGHRGAMSLEALDVDVVVKVPGGTIIARGGAGGSAADVNIGPEQGKLVVARGRVSTDLLGNARDLTAGQEQSWQHAADPHAVKPGPSYRNMETKAGGSLVVHAPELPVAVGFEFASKCRGQGLLDVVGGRQQARGRGSANLLFEAGTRGYTLRCLSESGTPSKIVARGTVQVLADSGTRKLPPRAPTSNVDADGRTYQIYYQNQLPDVIVHWPNAPSTPPYQLEIDGQAPLTLEQPEHSFRSGALRDGSHALVFSAKGRRSRTTTVEVRFDNAAPKAALSAPADRSFHAGDRVSIEGVALPTWKVSVEGGTISMSPGERFSGEVLTSKERPDVAVRLSHPRLGTHYYLRRAAESP